MILLFDSTGLVSQQVERKLRRRLPGVELESQPSFPACYQRLSRLRDAGVIVILAAESREQLIEFRKLRDLFIELKIILVLPDHESETVHLAHQLYPRYIGYVDAPPDDLVAVAARMHAKSPPRYQSPPV